MPESWSLVIALLLAVLVGASLPVLFQLFLTLGTARRTIRQLGPKLSEMLSELHHTTGRLNRATSGLDHSARRASSLFEAAGELGDSIKKLNRSMRPAVMFGTAIGPALAVAIKTMVDRYAAGDAAAEGATADPRPAGSTGETRPDTSKETNDE
ncbi:MAG TPA: DUF948 domain-containing protein [Candidatus Polarisedimenticolaceae bacterium]|nr:DUF948 domain-containing protein [Candidatus Polarisedimenticolaceae bacterium]